MSLNAITITLNPAMDIHYYFDKFRPFRENYVSDVKKEAGGKGVNSARALSAGGLDNIAFVQLGRDDAEDFEKQLIASGLNYRPFYIGGAIRKNITIHAPNCPETRISFNGAKSSPDEAKKLFAAAAECVEPGDIVFFSGRLPYGVGADLATEEICRLKDMGARIILDSNSFGLDAIKKVRPWLIKPNEQEIEILTGRRVGNIKQAVSAAADLRGEGVENVIISLGQKGAVYAGEERFSAKAPKISVLSTIGAGDSMLAGFAAEFSRGGDAAECLKSAVAYGSAACMADGTSPPRPDDISALRAQVEIQKY